MRTKKVFVEGMHCVSCENILEEEFGKIDGVKAVRVNRKTYTAEIDYEETAPDFFEIKEKAEKFGYLASENDPKKNKDAFKKFDWMEWAGAVLIVIVLFYIFNVLQGKNSINVSLEGNKMSYAVSLLIGLTASISSCLAVVGSVVIAFGEKYSSEGKSAFGKILKPNLLFHAGRLVAFFVLGGVLGLIGGKINVSGNFVSVYSMIIAVVMGWLGLSILGIIPSISGVGLHLPKSSTRRWKKLQSSSRAYAPTLLGAISFFLPCGFTQSMQIFALASGSFWVGAISLFLFALGTLPMLLFLGVTTSFTKDKGMTISQKVAGILVIIFAIYTLNSGLALRGVKSSVISSSAQEEKTGSPLSAAASSATQAVEMHVTSQGFQPAILKVKRGVPVEWRIVGDQVSGCTSKIVIPSLNLTKSIGSGINIVKFTPERAGEIPFSCWMGMVRGKFVVE